MRFAEYQALEAQLLARLARGDRAELVLGEEPLPPLDDTSWAKIAAELFETDDENRGGMAVPYFGDALLALTTGHNRRPESGRGTPRSSAARGPREEARVAHGGDRRLGRGRVVDDALADLGLPFEVARKELATRVHLARWLARRIERGGVRENQAAAEAVMIVELTACSEVWDDAVKAIAVQKV